MNFKKDFKIAKHLISEQINLPGAEVQVLS